MLCHERPRLFWTPNQSSTGPFKVLYITDIMILHYLQNRPHTFLFQFRYAVANALARYDATGSHADLPKSGRRRLSTARDDRALVRMSLVNRRATASELRTRLEDSGVHASRSTVCRRLREAGLFGRVARKQPKLTAAQRQRRLRFARDHEDWSWIDWSSVLFTDESRFTLYHNDGRVFVRRRTGESLLDACVVPTVKFGGGGVTVWGAMSYRGVGFLKTLHGNLNQHGYIDILGEYMVPSAHLLGYGDHYWFQDDNAPCHRARTVVEWKQKHDIMSLQWPAQSPDLNPI